MDALDRRMRWAERPDPRKRRHKSVSAKTPEVFVEKVAPLIDDVGWFGEPPFEPSLRKKPPNPAVENQPYVRRVLISWLVGRPVSQIAARAGCSPRLVHKILSTAIYFPPEPTLPFWRDLGLIGLLDVPRAKFSARVWEGYANDSAIVLEPWNLLVVCQICHRPAGTLECGSKFRRFDCRVVESEDLRWEEVIWRESGETQGHLICHFFLEGDPISVSGSPVLDRWAEWGGSPEASSAAKFRQIARRREHWSAFIGWRVQDVITEWQTLGEPTLLPIRDGAEMSPSAAERHWLRLLRKEK